MRPMTNMFERAWLVGAAVVLSGCTLYSARFSPPVEHESQVVLRENDFHYLERNLRGSDAYWSIALGFPGFALEIPLDDPRLVSNALAELYSRSQQQAEGKTTHLINWTLDYDGFWLPLFLRRAATFRADLIEYTK